MASSVGRSSGKIRSALGPHVYSEWLPCIRFVIDSMNSLGCLSVLSKGRPCIRVRKNTSSKHVNLLSVCHALRGVGCEMTLGVQALWPCVDYRADALTI